MTLVLRRSREQQEALERLLAELQDPSSPHYHQWLSPSEFGERFGADPERLDRAMEWLRSQGFDVQSTGRARGWITFRGTVPQVERAFHTEIHRYKADTLEHFAPSIPPSVPAEMASLVSGIRGLDDFRLQPSLRLKPGFSASDGTHALAPADVATIYDMPSFPYKVDASGIGLTIAVVGESAIDLSDVQKFRTTFQLPPNDPQPIVAGDDPGMASGAALQEAEADVEWAGAIAWNAKIVYAYATDVIVATQTVVDQNLAPILSFSFGICERNISSTDADFLRSLAQQATAQGITWVAASGDAGAAACDQGSNSATQGLSVWIPASLPEVTALGGTEFNEGQGEYWIQQNQSNLASVITYIPETAWNDSPSTGSLSASGGGASALFAKPPWQTVPGVPADGARDVPDVSLSASPTHDPYIVIIGGQAYGAGGTSLATPTFAGMLALAEQAPAGTGNAPSAMGNINPLLYADLGQAGLGVFHDITTGDNLVPCTIGTQDCTSDGSLGYKAGPGYDLVTGLGSIKFPLLQLGVQKATDTTLNVDAPQISVGTPLSFSATVRAYNGTAPSGTIYFTDVVGETQTTLGTVKVDSGGAAIASYLLGVGTHSLTAGFQSTFKEYLSSTSAAITVVVVPAPPVAPVLVSPPNNASDVPVGMQLKWNNPGAPVSNPFFDLYFGTNPAPSYWGRCTYVSGGCWPGALLVNTTYYWKVVATNDLGSVSSPVWSFTTTSASYTVSTIAGQVTTSGYSGDGTKAANALFGHPTDIALDRNGNLFIADLGIQYQSAPEIRMINTAGILSTVAGGGTGGNGSAATSAQLFSPVAVVVDERGDVYISDSTFGYSGWIWEVSNGIMTLVDGTDPATAHSVGLPLGYPVALALDSKQSVYIADELAHCVFEISNGVVSVFAGQCASLGFGGYGGDGGPAASASLSFPAGVAADPSGTVYISDSGNCKIRSVTSGIIATVIDFTADDPRCVAPPVRIAVDSAGSLYFYRPGGIYKWAAGVITRIAGGGEASLAESGPGTSLGFPNNFGSSFAVDPAGKVYFTDQSSIRALTPGYTPPVPTISANGIRNGASLLSGPIAPGSIAALIGNFGFASPAQSSGTPLPTTLGGLTIQMQSGTGINAPLFYTAEGQVNIQIPWELQGQSLVTVRAVLNGVVGPKQTVALAAFSPGIFVVNNQPVILDSSGKQLAMNNPTAAGNVIQIYCTGLGPVINPPSSGSVASDSSPTITNPIVTIGGANATVLSSRLVPGTVGQYQVKAQVPAGIIPGSQVSLSLSIGGVLSNTVTIVVR